MINFTRAFDSAWERMHIILFRPFDPSKWFVIGFSAFLALLAEGGVAINNSFPIGNQSQNYNYTYHSLPALLHGFKQLISWASSLSSNPWLALFVVLGIVYMIVWLVLNWVGCRGQFIFLDNIVRNRAAIAIPWRRYAHQGNIYFLFHLGLVLLSSFFYIVAVGTFLVLNWPWINAERNPAGNELKLIGVFLALLIILLIVYTAFLFLIRSFVVPLYFKQTMGLGAALLAVVRLTVTHPVSAVCYVLISFCLTLVGGVMTLLVFALVCCVLCWLACIPFVGSMLISYILCQLILPVLIFFRCFQLDCLAQFGPEFDVWIVDVAPPFTPPLPPG
jgi:hypothetical protein